LIQTVVAEGKATRKVCLDGEKTGNQHCEIALGATIDGNRGALPRRLGFRIAVGALNGYSDGRNRPLSGEYRLD